MILECMRWMGLVVAMLVVLWMMTTHYTFESLRLQDVISTCQTGDLIAFRYYLPSMTRMVSHMTHIGLVVRMGPRQHPYILETHASGDVDYLGNARGGVNMYDLPQRLRGFPFDGIMRRHSFV